MTEAQFAADQLRKRVHKLTGDSLKPITGTDIQQLPVDQSLLSDMSLCLNASDVETLSTGFFFPESLLQKNPGHSFGEQFFAFLVKRSRELLNLDNSFAQIKGLELFIWLRSNYADYRPVMLGYLSSSDLGLRKLALSHFETFSVAMEISPLITFSTDDYAAEYSMMGPMRYELRDLALKTIEIVAKEKFRLNELAEPYNGGTVTWYDWIPFQRWWIENRGVFQ